MKDAGGSTHQNSTSDGARLLNDAAWAPRVAQLPPVYCEACRYLQTPQPPPYTRANLGYRSLQHADWQCAHPHALQPHTSWLRATETRRHPSERNAANDCADFRPRTWWQQWGPMVLGSGLAGFVVLWLTRAWWW